MQNSSIRKFRESIRRLQRGLNWQWKVDAACCGITVAQCHALLEIGSQKEITLVDLSLLLSLDTSTLSRTIDGMSRADLVERKPNPDDRRYMIITLTEKGYKIYNEINQTFDHYYSDILGAIPAARQEQVLESIEILSKALAEKENSSCCKMGEE